MVILEIIIDIYLCALIFPNIDYQVPGFNNQEIQLDKRLLIW